MTGPLHPVRLCGATLATGALLCALLVGHGDKATPSGSAADQQPAGPTTPAQRVERGKYLARAADCAACHTAPNGAPFAGGYRLESSFGTFYSTNITPDKENGIGKWSADDFYQALHDGMAPARHLYPAMPYTSYRGMSRADSNAIYAYLMQLKPVPVPNRQPELSFPYSMRIALAGWNLLFLRNSLPDASSGQSPAWQRGRYLSNALGHCAECHTPRGMFGTLDGARPLAGAALSRIAAPDITPAGLAARGWTAVALQAFLATGIAPLGSAYGEMYPSCTSAPNTCARKTGPRWRPTCSATRRLRRSPSDRTPPARPSWPAGAGTTWPSAPAAMAWTARASRTSPWRCAEIPRCAIPTPATC
jgi:mono/diheme cytochrome c family protein